MSTVKVAVHDRNLSFIDMPTLSAKSANVDYIQFDFKDSTWDGFGIKCVFFKEKSDPFPRILDTNNRVKIPTNLLNGDGTIYFGLSGTKDDKRLTSIIASYYIQDGYFSADSGEDDPISQSIYEEILENYDSIKSEVNALKTKLKEPMFNVKDYGAVGDGVTDDGKSIQDALDDCHNVGGGTIYFPGGTYCISKTVFYYSNQTILLENDTILKRIKNAEQEIYSCGVFLCNWFESADTKVGTSKIACENVEIIGGTFDMSGDIGVTLATGSKVGVAAINTCHANKIHIRNCKFINNFTAHCIEVNSSDNVYIEGCKFSDYKGSEATYRYNEMIQIDKAVNAALGSKYDSSSIAVIKGYYKDTQISTSSPDCRGSNNIHIAWCEFVTNKYVVAIGNHHVSSYTTTNNDIKIHNNTFNGTTGDRGFINFDEHTFNVDIYDNDFVNGICGVTANADNANFTLHDNRFNSCSTISRGDVYAIHNFIDGIVSDSQNEIVGSVDEQSIYLDGFKLYDGFKWVYSGSTNENNGREYSNENIVQFRGIGMQLLQMCISVNEAITDTSWHDIGELKSGCQMPGKAPMLFAAPCSSGGSILIIICPKSHYSEPNKILFRVPSGSLSKGAYIFISRLVPCCSYEDNIEAKYGLTLNSDKFAYDLEDEYDNSTFHIFRNSPFMYFQICVSPKKSLSSTTEHDIGMLNDGCRFSGKSPYTFFGMTMKGIKFRCSIVPSEYADDASKVNSIRIRPFGGDISVGDRIYICACIDRNNGNQYSTLDNSNITLFDNFNWGLTNQYYNSDSIRFKDARLQKLNLCVEQKSSVSLSSGTWYDVGRIKDGHGFGGCSPIAILAYTNGGVPLLMAIVPEEHNSEHINKIRIKPFGAISYDPSTSYKHRIAISAIIPSKPLVSNNDSTSSSTPAEITSTSSDAFSLNTDSFAWYNTGQYANGNITRYSSGVGFIQMCFSNINELSKDSEHILGAFSDESYCVTGKNLFSLTLFAVKGSTSYPCRITIVPTAYDYKNNTAIRKQIRIKPIGNAIPSGSYFYLCTTIPVSL